MSQFHRISLFLLLLAISWFMMLLTHELGHVICGHLCGAKLTSVDLAPWRLPYSFHNPDPHPLITLWGGPALGIAIPFTVRLFWNHFAADFVANFCLLANGCYIGIGAFTGDSLLDSQRLVAEGASYLSLITFCAITIPLGYVRFRTNCVDLLTPKQDAPIEMND